MTIRHLYCSNISYEANLVDLQLGFSLGLYYFSSIWGADFRLKYETLFGEKRLVNIVYCYPYLLAI